MRFHILAAIVLLFNTAVDAQQNGKPAKTWANKTTNKNNPDQATKNNITADLIFSKVGKTKVTLSGIDYYAEPQLDRKKEIMYFLFERFNSKQVRKIVELSLHKDWNWDTLKSCYPKLNAYLIKAVSYYWSEDRYDNVALLYFPYTENIASDIPASVHPNTQEGYFLLVPYRYIKYDGQSLLQKWEEKPFAKLPNFTPDCKDLIYNYETPKPKEPTPVEAKKDAVTTTSTQVSKGMSKEKYIEMIYEAIRYIKDVQNSLDYFNANLYYKNQKVIDTRTTLLNIIPCNHAMIKFSDYANKTSDKEYNKTGLSPTQSVKFSNYDRKVTEINELMKTWTDRVDKQIDLLKRYAQEHNGKEPSSLQYLDDGQTEYKLSKKMKEFVEYFKNLYSQ